MQNHIGQSVPISRGQLNNDFLQFVVAIVRVVYNKINSNKYVNNKWWGLAEYAGTQMIMVGISGVGQGLVGYGGVQWGLTEYVGEQRIIVGLSRVWWGIEGFNGVYWALAEYGGVWWGIVGINGVQWALAEYGGVWQGIVNICTGMLLTGRIGKTVPKFKGDNWLFEITQEVLNASAKCMGVINIALQRVQCMLYIKK